jgi:hypothetical protein
MTASRNPYVVLGLLPKARPEEVQRAFRRLVRQHHPDTAGGPGDPDELSAVLAAYAAVRAGHGGGDPDGAEPDSAGPDGVTAATGVTPRHHHPAQFLREPSEAEPPSPPIRVGPVRWHRRPR